MFHFGFHCQIFICFLPYRPSVHKGPRLNHCIITFSLQILWHIFFYQGSSGSAWRGSNRLLLGSSGGHTLFQNERGTPTSFALPSGYKPNQLRKAMHTVMCRGICCSILHNRLRKILSHLSWNLVKVCPSSVTFSPFWILKPFTDMQIAICS